LLSKKIKVENLSIKNSYKFANYNCASCQEMIVFPISPDFANVKKDGEFCSNSPNRQFCWEYQSPTKGFIRFVTTLSFKQSDNTILTCTNTDVKKAIQYNEDAGIDFFSRIYFYPDRFVLIAMDRSSVYDYDFNEIWSIKNTDDEFHGVCLTNDPRIIMTWNVNNGGDGHYEYFTPPIGVTHIYLK